MSGNSSNHYVDNTNTLINGKEKWIPGKVTPTGSQVTEPTKLASERGIGEADEYGVSVGEWNMTPVAASQADVAVSSGVPVLIKKIIMGTGQTGQVTLKDGAITVQAITPGANLAADYDGGILETSCVITTAASAACVVVWRVKRD